MRTTRSAAATSARAMSSDCSSRSWTWRCSGTASWRARRTGSPTEAWATSLLERVPGELVVVGASMGGYCALALARLAPERVRGLVLAGSRADADSPEREEARQTAIERIEREGAEGMWRLMEPIVAGEIVPHELRER